MKLKDLRTSKSLKQDECAVIAGVSLRTYKKYENDPTLEGSVKYNHIYQLIKEYEQKDCHLKVVTGNDLKILTSIVKDYDTRDCFEILKDYYQKPFPNKVLILYGLRRTGKTTLIFQSIRLLKYHKCAYIKASPSNNMQELLSDIEALRKKGYKYLFIDEITLLEDFIDGAAVLSDIFANLDLKIVLSGTDSLGFYFTSLNELYDRSIIVHTSFIPFREYVRLLDIPDIDMYIAYGGTLKKPNINFDDERYKYEELSFADDETTRKYINSSIVKNILHSLKNDNIGNKYNKLKELYDENELVNVINRIINNYNHAFIIRVINEIFKSNDLGAGKTLLLHEENETLRNALYTVNEKEVLKRMKEILEIEERDDKQIEITPLHLEQLKDYLYKLDLIDDIEVHFDNGEIEKHTIFTQPGMRYSLVKALIHSLSKDPHFASLKNEDMTYITYKLLDNVRGIMLEDITLYETKKVSKNKDVFKYKTFNEGEYDMVIYDKEKNTCHLYEIKHSHAFVFDQQTRHLRNDALLNKIMNKYGAIATKNVLYRGLPRTVNNINFIDIEDYLFYIA